MAMNDVTYIGFTPAAVDSQFVDLSSNRQTGDTNNQNKINTQLIDMDAQNKDIDYNTRTTIRNISDYWVRRRQALERVLPEDILQSFKK